MKKRLKSAVLPILPLYLFTLVFVLGPLVYMIVLSVSSRSGQWGISNEFTLNNYARIREPIFLQTFWQSIKLALISTLTVALMGYPFGYFMAKLSPKWRGLLMFFLIIPFWTSSLMRLYGWMIVFRANGVLDKLLMGIGITKQPLKLLYTYPAVVVGMIYVLLPFMIYSVFTSAEKLDWSCVEASRDLGGNAFTAFITVTLPMTAPGLASGIVLTFIPSMGLYFIADLLGGNKVVLVGNLIQEELMKAHDWPFAAALSVLLMALTSLFLLLYRRLTHSSDLEGLV